MAMSGKKRAGTGKGSKLRIGTRAHGWSKSFGRGISKIPPFKHTVAKGVGKKRRGRKS